MIFTISSVSSKFKLSCFRQWNGLCTQLKIQYQYKCEPVVWISWSRTPDWRDVQGTTQRNLSVSIKATTKFLRQRSSHVGQSGVEGCLITNSWMSNQPTRLTPEQQTDEGQYCFSADSAHCSTSRYVLPSIWKRWSEIMGACNASHSLLQPYPARRASWRFQQKTQAGCPLQPHTTLAPRIVYEELTPRKYEKCNYVQWYNRPLFVAAHDYS